MSIQVRRGINSGHGHVFLRPDKVRTRCGGPGMCKLCSADLVEAQRMHDGGCLALGSDGIFDIAALFELGVSPTPPDTKDTFADAFYELAEAMDIPAQPISPKEVFDTQMLPKLKQALAVLDGQAPMRFLYENHRKETDVRNVLPIRIYHGTTEYYPEPGYLLEAFDKDRGAVRTFSMSRIKYHFS